MKTQPRQDMRPALAAAIVTISLLASATAWAKGDNTLAGKVHFKDKKGNPITDASDAVVYLEEVPGGSTKPQNDHPSIASRNKDFVPVVLPIVKGQTVDFPNDDLILHNVFSLSKTHAFDLGLYKKGSSKTEKFDKRGVVKVYCNIHEKMAAYIVVLDNPYFALTKADGGFSIEHVPDGTYAVSVWQRYGPQVTKKVSVHDGAKADVDFSLDKGDEVNFDVESDPLPIHHMNKFGKEYPSKY